jgi:hypothetical protein
MSNFILHAESNISGPIELHHAKGSLLKTESNFTYKDGTLHVPTVEADAIVSRSDERFKENIENIQNCLDKLLKLQAKCYNYKDKDKNDKHYGFIAQEVQTIFPTVVRNGENDMLYVNYVEIIPIITEAIKELFILIKQLAQK